MPGPPPGERPAQDRARATKDSMLKMYQQQKKLDREPSDDYPMSSYPPVRTPPLTMSTPMSTHYDDSMRYASTGDPAASINGSSYHHPTTPDYPQRSPAMAFAHDMTPTRPTPSTLPAATAVGSAIPAQP
ncbi:hypothetical protein BN946_scf184911.g24 [Trametes cinnabarina]|uniref:Uncharacterized protein n=1 Tax=Pycnoporus cinnabarinus TaxID=5643 RepID=A0A060SH33_PYCCI|nr:hypothetical protein BN946_scf184911.g24 [Trametes cinnabarina]